MRGEKKRNQVTFSITISPYIFGLISSNIFYNPGDKAAKYFESQ